MSKPSKENIFYQSDKPEIALIANHGYGGADIPIGGAPDTGGQNFYVNTLALKLERLGYKVTIFARGGFPYYKSNLIRSKPEYLARFVRYIFVPGGGDAFVRKEDIAIALDEELEWIDAFVRKEAEAKGCEPWEVYEFVNSHYWDAGVLGVRLVERWRNDVVEQSMKRMLEGIIPSEILEQMHLNRHWRSMGEVPYFHIGYLLIHRVGLHHFPIEQQVRVAASTWAAAKGLDIKEENYLVDSAEKALSNLHEVFAPELKRLVASAALGQSILMLSPDVDERLKRDLDRVNKHVWTPHSLAEIKDYNFRNRLAEVRRNLKFCERRSHERMISCRTHAFIATSAKIAEKLWTHYQVPVEDTFYFPPCIDRQVFRPYEAHELNPTYRYLSKISGIAVNKLKNGKIIFETSRMDQTKRKDLLLAAFTRILPDYDDLYLFIGGGPANEIFQMLANQLRFTEALEGRAFLTGPIPSEYIGPMFSLADIYATASEMEGFGMCVSQAASAGTAIVSSNIIPFSLHHVSEYVELFPTGDVAAFAKGIRQILDNEDEYNKKAQHLRDRTLALDWDVKTTEFLAYLRLKGIEVKEGKKEV